MVKIDRFINGMLQKAGMTKEEKIGLYAEKKSQFGPEKKTSGPENLEVGRWYTASLGGNTIV